MSYIIGIDIGGSTTKIIGLKDGRLIGAARVKASDPLTSAYGAFGRFLEDNGLRLNEVEKVMCTGVGSSFLRDEIYGIPAEKVDEFRAVGLGAKYTSGLDRFVAVSLGTGTSFTVVRGEEITYVGGSGVGGGTITGLCQMLAGSKDHARICELAVQGNTEKVDLTIGDITKERQLANLNMHVTASNFGKISDDATEADFAMGVINMVFQIVGTMAMMTANGNDTDSIVLTGSLSQMEAARPVLRALEDLYHVRYIVPEDAEYATAIGAALHGIAR